MTPNSGVLIAANASGCGKTTAALGLICALTAMGHEVWAAKCGPDYIDASWLSRATGRPCANLDQWMGKSVRPDVFNRIGQTNVGAAAATGSPVVVVEGAMGIYDGNKCGRGSCAEIASIFSLPILLLLNVKGLGQTCAAIANGILSYSAPWMKAQGHPRFMGILLTHVSSENHFEICRRALQPVLKNHRLSLFGYLAQKDVPHIPSRHLGLVGAEEHSFEPARFASWFTSHCDMKNLCAKLHINDDATSYGKPLAPCSRKRFFCWNGQTRKYGPTVAIANDAAFPFCYADLPVTLAELGAKIVFFSPLSSPRPPECDAIYFPGGYPELYANELGANTDMIASLRKLAKNNLPILGECGGFIYLGTDIEMVDGKKWRMSGILPISFYLESRLSGLGYREAMINCKWLDRKNPVTVRGHEFHYARISAIHETGIESFIPQARDSAGNSRKLDAASLGSVMGSWLHLYPQGSRQFWRAWLKKAGEYGQFRKSHS